MQSLGFGMQGSLPVNPANSAQKFGKDMDDRIQKSCWGVTAKAVMGFAGIILLAWLVGGSETSAMLAGAS